jgi:hypothetical protein
MSCSARTLVNLIVYGTVWNPASGKAISVGRYATYPTVIAMDSTGNKLWSHVYVVNSLQSASFSTINALTEFVGSFIAGYGVSSSSGASISILGGWFHSDLGRMYSVLSLTPRAGTITSSTELVHALVVESVSLDSIVAGGIQLRTGSGSSSTVKNMAYIVRFNALFQSVVFGMYYTSSLVPSSRSTAKAIAVMDNTLYLICDVLNSQLDQTDMVVLKLNIATGAILKQVKIIGPSSITCTKVTNVINGKFTVSCSVRKGNLLQPLLFAVDEKLSFQNLLDGYERIQTDVLQAVATDFAIMVLPVTQSATTVVTTKSSFNSSAGAVVSAPTRLPSLSPTQRPTRGPTAVRPSSQPSSQPSAHPSRQPTSRPTAAPSVSPAPTAVPSTATPTSTHRPSGQPSSQPSAGPTGQPVSAPSGQPSAPPSGQPTGQPVGDPTAQPSRQPLSQPTGQPSVSPTSQPSAAPTCEPAADPTSQPSNLDVNSNLPVSSGSAKQENIDFVVPVTCSLAGVAALLLCLYYRSVIYYSALSYVSGPKKLAAASITPVTDDSADQIESGHGQMERCNSGAESPAIAASTDHRNIPVLHQPPPPISCAGGKVDDVRHAKPSVESLSLSQYRPPRNRERVSSVEESSFGSDSVELSSNSGSDFG